MEKSFLTFQATYPAWEPDASGRDMLNSLNGFTNANESALGRSADLSASVLKRSTRLKDLSTSPEKAGVRHRGGNGNAILRQPAHGSGSMFQPAFVSDIRDGDSLVEALSASQTVLQHFYEDQADTHDVDTAARNSPTRDDVSGDAIKAGTPTIDMIQMYQRPAATVTQMVSFPEEASIDRAQNGQPSVLDSCLLPTSTVLPPVEDATWREH
jgi:hypothetical protein